MNTIVKWGIGLGFLVIVVVCVLNMLGLNDVVLDAGEAIRPALTRSQDSKRSRKNPKSDYASQTLGWDVRDVHKQPVATVKKGIAVLRDLIDKLETRKSEIALRERRTGRRSERDSADLKGYKDLLIVMQNAYKNPDTTYPLDIKGYKYATKEELVASFGRVKSKYQSLKNSYDPNIDAEAKRQKFLITQQLREARSALDLLNTKLAKAEGIEIGRGLEESRVQVDEMIGGAESIISERDDPPSGSATLHESDLNDIMNFKP